MGYTHYFAYAPKDETFIAAWPQMVADAQRIVEHVRGSGIIICGWDGTGEPELEVAGRIRLNGTERDDLDHETLGIDPKPWRAWEHPENAGTRWAERQRDEFAQRGFLWAFCKTARKPYDGCVGAILLRCVQLAPDAFVIASDGSWDCEWRYSAGVWSNEQIDALYEEAEREGTLGAREYVAPASPRGIVRELFGSDTGAFGDTLDGPPCTRKASA